MTGTQLEDSNETGGLVTEHSLFRIGDPAYLELDLQAERSHIQYFATIPPENSIWPSTH
jgi:hypothetical protein